MKYCCGTSRMEWPIAKSESCFSQPFSRKPFWSSTLRGIGVQNVVATLIAALLVTLMDVHPSSLAGEVYTQAPTVARSQPRSNVAAAPIAQSPGAAALADGPKPSWIWGEHANAKYRLRKLFRARSRGAWLKASCDNRMELFINGQQVVSSDNWQQPVELDIQKYLRRRNNEIMALVENAGGPSGFACKLAFVDGTGNTTYIVSDDTWEAVEDGHRGPWGAVESRGKLGIAPWNDVFADTARLVAHDRNVFNVPPGFQVELIYTVPMDQLGSWVAITFDDKGRLIVSDQGNKGLCRVTPPPIGADGVTSVEHLDLHLTSAQGLLYAFDSLYVSVNGGPGSGLYRAKDTTGDDQFDLVEKLKALRGRGEHGPHALRLSPDGKSIYLVCGNHTDPPRDVDASRVPANWGEDLLLPRQWDARGHARGKLAPGGWIAKTDPDGKTWEIISTGYRNAYDMDFNTDGELFAYDADMEWDMGTPWYRPTRVVHAVSGSDFGWRSGTGKWPTYYVDSLPSLLDVGPGSPVGVTFGYGTRFPAKYQKAFFICDWTFGTMYAVHMEAEGASYRAWHEEFISRTPLPLTDNAVGPDGSLYFTVGGRGAQSELYRVTYVGDESTEPVSGASSRFAELRQRRRRLEKLHGPLDPLAARGDESRAFIAPAVLNAVWKRLGHPDRHIRYAARVALEHQDVSVWQDRVFSETDPQTLITAAVALARQGDPSLRSQLLTSLDRIDFRELTGWQQLELLRAWSLVFIRMGRPDQESTANLAAKLDEYYPADGDSLNRELCRVLVYLNSPTVTTKTLELIEAPSRQDTSEISPLLARNAGYGGTIARMLKNQVDLQKLHYAFVLRNMRYGWTLQQRRQYFAWLAKAREKSGGASYRGFIDNIRREALEYTTQAERMALESTVQTAAPTNDELPKPRGPGHEWTLEELVALTETGLEDRDYQHGRKMFAAARCIVCHRFAGEGGATGPDLTNVAGRFSFKDLSEATVNPSKVISDQYRASVILTSGGQAVTGRVAGHQDGKLTVLVDPEDANEVVEIPSEEIETITPSNVSLMPKDLLNPLNQDEVLDLLAFLQSRGNPNDTMFSKQ